MTRLSLVALSVTALFVAGTNAGDSLEYGMDMSIRAYDAVCWYENLKQFPNTHAKEYNKCGGQQKYQKNEIETNAFFKGDNAGMKEEYFGKWTDDKVIGKLPKPYKDACSKYLKDSKAQPSDDESDALNDPEKEYPYRGYAHCLMHTLREQHGDDAITAVKSEKTHTRKNWMQAINDRENEFRARHGSDPLKLVKDLNEAAQTWADKMASECNMYHSKNTDAGRQWNGASTGESLSAAGGEDDKEIAAYQAADGWYEEIKDYPYPDGYQGGDQALFMKIGHFTQSVWKGTTYVGYGYAFNDKCKDQSKSTRYVAARYSPAGNVDGKYPENVAPPKDSK